MMNNIYLVTSFMADEIKKDGGDVTRETMSLILTKDNKQFYLDGKDCYRILTFIKNTKVYQKVEDAKVFESSGYAFGTFIKRLDKFDATKLVEVLPNFHNTALRYKNFEKALAADVKSRAKDVQEEINFVKERKEFMSKIVNALESKEIPLRVTHNDTKLNNVLMDIDTNKAICVVDLDTIMPGSLLYDFGDSVRFGCSTALEDEKDLSKVDFDINLYDSYCKGFLSGIQDKMTKNESMMLHIGSMMMTLECGMRFLTDYLEGDTYFKIKYEDHNLVRCRTQLKLVKCMENLEKDMLEIAAKYYKN